MCPWSDCKCPHCTHSLRCGRRGCPGASPRRYPASLAAEALAQVWSVWRRRSWALRSRGCGSRAPLAAYKIFGRLRTSLALCARKARGFPVARAVFQRRGCGKADFDREGGAVSGWYGPVSAHARPDRSRSGTRRSGLLGRPVCQPD